MAFVLSPEAARPRLRGWLHEIAFFASFPLGAVLVVAARGTPARVAALVYALSATALYGASAAYHRLRVDDRVRAVLRRVDHSMIFVLIAGSYTPFGLIVVHGPWSIALLAAVWAGALGGIAIKIVRFAQWRRLGAALYIVLGWAAVFALPQLIRELSPLAFSLVVAGGIVYTLGAIGLALKRPNPFPATFGYHEIWHTMVVLAGLCHYVAVFSIIRP